MSISDVLVMHLPNGDRFFYVDFVGFTEVKFDENGKMMATKDNTTENKK